MINTINSLTKKLQGFFPFPRNTFLLLKNRQLTDEELILFEFGIAITDWDKTHSDTYGSFKASDNQIGLILYWSASKVNRNKNRLLKKRFFVRRDDQRIEIKDFHQYEIKTAYRLAKNKNSDLQDEIARMKSEPAKPQESSAEMQVKIVKENDAIQNQDIANLQDSDSKSDLVSYKDNISLIRSDEEYQKILEEGNYTMLTIEDMKWIDWNY